MTLDQVAAAAQAIGVAGLLAVAIYGRFRQWWVDGPTHRAEVDELRADRDFWKGRALKSLDLAARSTHVAEQAITKSPPS